MKIKSTVICFGFLLSMLLRLNVYGTQTDYDVSENVLHNAVSATVSADNGNPNALNDVGAALTDGVRESAPTQGRTKWLILAPKKEAYAQFELAEPTAVYEISVYSQTGSGVSGSPITGFILQASMDGNRWEDVVSVSNNKNNLCVRQFDAVVGKYFRVMQKSTYGFRVTEIQLKQAYSYANFENELDINDIYKAGRFVYTFIVNCSQELEPELEISINGDTCETSKAADNNTFKWSIDVPVDKSTDEYSVRGRLYSKKYNITLLEIVRDLRFYHYVEFLNIVNDNDSTGEFTASFNAISDLVISYGYDTQLLLKDSSAAISKRTVYPKSQHDCACRI